MILPVHVEIGGKMRLCTLKEGFDRNLVSDGLFFQLGMPLEVEKPEKREPTVTGPNGEVMFAIGWAKLSFELGGKWITGRFEVVCMVDMSSVVNFDVVVSRRLAPVQISEIRIDNTNRVNCRFCHGRHKSSVHHRLRTEQLNAEKIKTLLKL